MITNLPAILRGRVILGKGNDMETVKRPETWEEIEALSIGVDTGYRDRNGTPIRVGDKVVYYKKAIRPIDDDEDIRDFLPEYVVGKGVKGYVYTGRVSRFKSTVKFSFNHGLEILDGGRYKYLFEKDADGNLVTILVDNEGKNPKLSFEEVIAK